MTFTDFPEIGNGLRLVATTVMDEEQFTVEEWHLYRDVEMRPTLQGIQAYAQLRRQRREERKSAWQTRRDAEEEYSGSIQALIERETEK